MGSSWMLLRRHSGASDQAPPFPKQQMFILGLCRICEPIAFMSIFPYIYRMILSFDITTNDDQIAIYAGMVTSAFAFAEFSSSVMWGRLSDKVGRKPVLLCGLAGTGLSMLIFGFAKSLPMALVGRALGGLLNGNIGVLQTTVAELVVVKEHQPRAYSIMPFVWCLGSIIGPAMGGALAEPCLHYPSFFPRGGIFDKYPFLLPNLICTIILGLGVIVGILFLEETHEGKRQNRDVGIETGMWILSILGLSEQPLRLDDLAESSFQESELLLEDKVPLCYETNKEVSCSLDSRPQSPHNEKSTKNSRAAQKAFTRTVIMNIIGYGILAYHTISFDQLMPILLSSDISHDAPSSLVKFKGGFDLTSQTIGILQSIQGVYSLAAQMFLFPFVVRQFGTLRTFRFIVFIWPLLYLGVPYLLLLPRQLQMPGIIFCLIWRSTAQVLAFPSNAILLTNSAPSSAVLGLINGAAASTASLSRAFSPTLSGTISSWGERIGYSGIVWWMGGLIALIGALESLCMEEGRGRLDVVENKIEDKIDSSTKVS